MTIRPKMYRLLCFQNNKYQIQVKLESALDGLLPTMTPSTRVCTSGVRLVTIVMLLHMHRALRIAVAMLPINAAVYVFDGVITGAADFKFMAGECLVQASPPSACL